MKTTNEFLKEAKLSIIYAFVQPKSESPLYTNPMFLWTSSGTLVYRLSCNIRFDQEEIVFENLRKNETYVSIDYTQIQKFLIKPVQRIHTAPYQTHHVEFFLKAPGIDVQVETKDIDHLLALCVAIHHKGITIQDPCDILKVMIKTRKEPNQYYEYMLKHYADYAKQYGLEHPRVKVDR